MLNRFTAQSFLPATFQIGAFLRPLSNAAAIRRRAKLPRVGAPTVVNPTPLPLIDQRTVRAVLVSASAQRRIGEFPRMTHSHLRSPIKIRGSEILLAPGVVSGASGATAGSPMVLAAPVLVQAPPWRFVVTDLHTRSLSFLDRVSKGRSIDMKLNETWTATGAAYSNNPEVYLASGFDGDPYLAEGNRILYGFRREGRYVGDVYAPWKCRYAGLILQINDTVQGDVPTSQYTAFDPWTYLMSRPVCLPDGSFPGQNGLTFPYYDSTFGTVATGGEIALFLLRNTIKNHGDCHIDLPVVPGHPEYGGSGYYGSDASIDAIPEVDISFQQGDSVGDAWKQLCETNLMDIVLRPIYDPHNRPGYCSEIGIHQQLGTTKPAAQFSYDIPPRTVTNFDRLEDGTQRANVVQFFTSGGYPMPRQSDTPSETKYGEYWAMQTFSGEQVPQIIIAYAQMQLLIRKHRSTTIKVNPAPERAPIPLTEYNVGDTVPLYASRNLRKPANLTGRIYGFTINIEDSSVETVSELDFSADSLGAAL